MKKRTKVLIWILVAIAAVLLVIYFAAPKTSTYQTTNVKTGNIETWYSYSGTLEAAKKQDIVAAGDYTIDEIYYGSGSYVNEDDVVLDSDNGDEWTASMDGRVIGLGADPGDDVTAGTVLATIVEPSSWQTTINVDEYDAAQMQTGEAVTVKVNSLGITLIGSIKRIATEAVKAGNVTVFPVTISIADDGSLKPGLSVEVQIPKASATDVLIVPVKAVGYDSDGKAYVYTLDQDKKEVKTAVETGISDSQYTEIKSGLTDGQEVVIPDSGSSIEEQVSAMRSSSKSNSSDSSSSGSSDSSSSSATDSTSASGTDSSTQAGQ
ncbi:MAG: efflux RND transporter periplasmic adaptor subunit [Eubacteriaceae bacterium]